MTIQFYESPGRKSTKQSAERIYVCVGTSDESLVRSIASASTPTVHNMLLRNEISVEETGPESWLCNIKYGTKKEEEAGDWKWDFDTTGGTQKITQSKANIANYAPSGTTAPNFKGAIGVTDDSVEGCEITVPQFKWNETHQLDAAQVTWTYSQVLRLLTGRTNMATFRGFAAGTVLFLGAKGSASMKAPGIVEVSFSFAASEPGSSLTVGDISGINKASWDYLWVRYGTGSDATAKKLIKKPSSDHVERVYDPGDFSLLLIGS